MLRSFSWSANVAGRKRWRLLPPGATHLLYDRFGRDMAPDFAPSTVAGAPLRWLQLRCIYICLALRFWTTSHAARIAVPVRVVLSCSVYSGMPLDTAAWVAYGTLEVVRSWYLRVFPAAKLLTPVSSGVLLPEPGGRSSADTGGDPGAGGDHLRPQVSLPYPALTAWHGCKNIRACSVR